MPSETGDFTARFGERLRELRTERGMSQEELAHAAGLHRTHVSLIERDRRSVRLETLARLAGALGVGPSALVPPGVVGGPAHEPVGSGHHPDKVRLDRLFPAIREYQELASRHGIGDIFQDNGGKLLQTLLILNLTFIGRREGNDARDDRGNEYELKTVNIDLTQYFTTHHHLNPKILKKYREVTAWFFSIYRGIEVVEIYRMSPDRLESKFFSKWEKKWRAAGGKDLNNPHIPVSFVRSNGELVYRDPVNDRL